MANFLYNLRLYLARPLTDQIGKLVTRLEDDKRNMREQIFNLDQANYKLTIENGKLKRKVKNLQTKLDKLSES